MSTQAADAEESRTGLWGPEMPRGLHTPVPAQTVVIWCFSLSASESQLAKLEDVLSPDERARLSCYAFAHTRRAFTVARAALRIIIAKCVGASPSTLHFEYGVYGKPRLAPPFDHFHFNLSHSGDIAVVAASVSGAIGIDIERIRPVPETLDLARGFFSRGEYELLCKTPHHERDRIFLSLWTRKEACLKAIGAGLAIGTKQIDATASECVFVAAPPDSATAGCTKKLLVRDFQNPPGYVAAVATDYMDCTLNLKAFAVGEAGN